MTVSLKQCKAIGKDCFNCGKEGHFSQVCRNNKKDSRKFLNKANNILEESSEESHVCIIRRITEKSTTERKFF